jgi:hypothetical protein
MSMSRQFALCVLLVVSPVVAHADVVLDWNARMFTTITGQSPFGTARLAAITQLAVFEAVNAITKTYEPYLGTIDAPDGASAEAAAATAAHTVLKHYFGAQAVPLDNALAATLATIPDGQAKTDGIATGLAAGQAMIALRANDGSAPSVPPTFYVPPSSDPGQWQRTPSCPPGGGTNFHWRDVTPFGVPAVSDFRLGPPPGMAQGKYAKDFVEVASVGGTAGAQRTQDREDIARFYAAFSPVAWANGAARQVASAQGRSLAENARALALVNMAQSDAAVAVFDTKYHYNLWRPETAIKAADLDGNHKTGVDPGFLPLITAPCFPSYPSAHGTLSTAAQEVLERLYGPDGHDISFTSAVVPNLTLHYTAFKRIVEDISDARVFGGIHFRFDQDGGERQGTAIGKYVFKNNLRPSHP